MTAGGDHPEPSCIRDGRVVGPWSCLRCGYGLEHLRPSDPCPECETPVARSIDPRLLRFAPLSALDRARRGARTINLALVAWIVSVPGLMLFYALGDLLIVRGRVPATPIFESPLAVCVVGDILVTVLAFGIYALTTRLPAHTVGRGTVAVRRALRVTAVLFSVGVFSFQALALAEWLFFPDMFLVMHPGVPVFMLSFTLGCAGAIALGLPLYAWTLGERTWWRGRPLRAIAVATPVFAVIGAILGLALGALAEPMFVLLDQTTWHWLQWIYVSSMIALGCFIAIGLLAAFVTMHAFSRCLRRDYREAAAAGAAPGVRKEASA